MHVTMSNMSQIDHSFIPLIPMTFHMHVDNMKWHVKCVIYVRKEKNDASNSNTLHIELHWISLILISLNFCFLFTIFVFSLLDFLMPENYLLFETNRNKPTNIIIIYNSQYCWKVGIYCLYKIANIFLW